MINYSYWLLKLNKNNIFNNTAIINDNQIN